MSLVSRIADELRALGVRANGVLLVHASLKALGPLAEGPPAVCAGLCRAVGPEGTVLMPTFTYDLAYQPDPCFDQRATPSVVGALSEIFRHQPGVRRSLHPTHSVAGLGPAFDGLVAGHLDDDTPCGPHSPFQRLLRRDDAQVLFLGCGLRPNSCMHAVEELLPAPYLIDRAVQHRVLGEDGSERRPTIHAYGFRRHGLRQRYDRLAELLRPGELRQGGVLAATAQLVEAPAILRRGLERLRQDPYAFVERIPANPSEAAAAR